MDPGAALSEALPPLSPHEALVESNRCLYCFDAPCTHACPTHIDIPRFIKKIATANLPGSARTILESNLLGATCARVCPVEELCEGACVLGAEHRPIRIGRLQRYAMDQFSERGLDLIRPACSTGHSVAVVGSGPAGLSCAGELAKRGHSVTIFEKRDLPGGLSTYGIIALREPIDAALAEAALIQRLGVEIKTGVELGRDLSIDNLRQRFEAVFLAVGLGPGPGLGIPGEEKIRDGLEYIEQSKLNPAQLTIGRDVVVIGGGNTAIDCATVARRLGAPRVTMLYRRGENEITAYRHELDFVRREGLDIRFLTQPVRILDQAVECVRMRLGEPDASGRPAPAPVPGSHFLIRADQVIQAIGQQLPPLAGVLGLATRQGKIAVDDSLETSRPGIFAGGDCIRSSGAATTVMGVQDGKIAASAIHARLMQRS